MFESAKSKLEWAKKHIIDLRAATQSFLDRHPYTINIDADSDNLTLSVCLKEQMPTELPLLMGDAVHNLRTVLDHATWSLLGIDRGTQDRSTSFPNSKTKEDYERLCKGLKTCRNDSKEFFLALEAYQGGTGSKLYELSKLNNVDKHRFLMPIVGVVSIDEVKVLSTDGQVYMTMQDCSFSMGPDGVARILNVGSPLRIDLRNAPEAKVDILFGDVEFFNLRPAVSTLTQLSEDVSNVLGQFESLVNARN